MKLTRRAALFSIPALFAGLALHPSGHPDIGMVAWKMDFKAVQLDATRTVKILAENPMQPYVEALGRAAAESIDRQILEVL